MYFSATEWEPSPKPAPEGAVLFAVGDVHGQADLLKSMHTVLRQEIAHSQQLSVTVVHVGDYIDRGPDSQEVLQLLVSGLGVGSVDEVYLVGNHDQYLIEMLGMDGTEDPDALWGMVGTWLDNGGEKTLGSFGVPLLPSYTKDLGCLKKALTQAIHPKILNFLHSLVPYHLNWWYCFHSCWNPPKHATR